MKMQVIFFFCKLCKPEAKISLYLKLSSEETAGAVAFMIREMLFTGLIQDCPAG